MQRTHAVANRASHRGSAGAQARRAREGGLPEQVLALQRLCGNYAVQRLLSGSAAATAQVVQRETYDDFGHPFPDDKDQAEYSQEGPAAWQHIKLKKGLGEFIVGVLGTVGGKAVVQAMLDNESKASKKTEFRTEAMSPDTGGSINWKNPWVIKFNARQTLMLNVITAAHELRHQQQVLALGLGQEAGPVDMAALDMRAKEAAALIAGNLQSREQGRAIDDKRRWFLGGTAPQSIKHQEESQLGDAGRRKDNEQDRYYEYWFMQYVPNYCDTEFDSFLDKKFGTKQDTPDSEIPQVKAINAAIRSLRPGSGSKFWINNSDLVKKFVVAYAPWEREAIAKGVNQAAATGAVQSMRSSIVAEVANWLRAQIAEKNTAGQKWTLAEEWLATLK